MNMEFQDLADKLQRIHNEWGGGDIGWLRVAEEVHEKVKLDEIRAQVMQSPYELEIEVEPNFEVKKGMTVIVQVEGESYTVDLKDNYPSVSVDIDLSDYWETLFGDK